MDGSRLVIAQFCDDIRQEVGNKYSLIGCYGNEMIVDNIPAVLPKLCAHIRVITPSDRPLAQLTIRAILNDETLAEIEMPVTNMIDDFKKKASESDLGRMTFLAMIVLSPLSVAEPGKIQIEAETEDGIIHGSFLKIRERTQADSPIL